MPAVADYQAIEHRSIKLPVFSDDGLRRSFSRNFNPPNTIRLEHPLNRPILCYRVDPTNDARNLQLTVSIRDQSGATRQLNSFTFGGGVSRTINEIVSHQFFDKGNNLIIFELKEGGTGSLAISDIIIWFQREV